MTDKILVENIRKEKSKHTPKEIIDKMNEKFPDWKTTEQINMIRTEEVKVK